MQLSLTIEFRRSISGHPNGIFRSRHVDARGIEHIYLATHMEPIYASHLFPCFDDPAHKARFTIHVQTTPGGPRRRCLSNMPLLSVQEDVAARRVLYTFAETVLMSTYASKLLALVIGDLDSIPGNSSEEGVPVVTLYAPAGFLSPESRAGDLALDLAVRGLRLFASSFGTPYPLPKLDLVAIPDFASGAMENWGLILFQPQKLFARDGRVVADCVLHEVAHQWLGNLVTPPSWNELWLKEGLAVWAAAYATERLSVPNGGPDSDSDSWADFVGDSMQQALALDGLATAARAVRPSDVGSGASALFDAISYRKGACLIRMAEGMIGRRRLLEGIRRYIREHMWANAGTEAFWMALASPEFPDLVGRMKVWTTVPGFPIVRVLVEEERDGGGSVLRLSQEPFVPSRGSFGSSGDGFRYPLQITVVTESGETRVEVPGPGGLAASIPLSSVSAFWLINPRYDSFCRVVYPAQHVQRLLAGEQDMERITKIGLLADTAALCRAGYMSTTIFLDAIQALSTAASKAEMDWVIWKHMVEHIGEMVVSFRTCEEEELIRRLEEFSWHVVLRRLCDLLSTHCRRKSGDDEIDSMMGRVISKAMWATGAERFLCQNGDATNQAYIRHIPRILLCTADIRSALGRVSSFANNPTERLEALENLGYILHREAAAEALTWLTEPGNVKIQEVLFPLQELSRRRVGIVEMSRWARKNWKWIQENMPLNMTRSMVRLLYRGISTCQNLEEMEVHFRNVDDAQRAQYSSVLLQEREKAADRIKWRERDSEKLSCWLEAHRSLLSSYLCYGHLN
ncbi:peptidase family M1-domain-containing protein [Lasiosphaeria ovina]|uniref:Aminopeptidase n=1 Tax=Lasiosphaeria ovina TaxID=92902 RepID=A0AAE0KJG0_9PEZI|nr:peptidase family M1-domain-containing protein [Lasiosphaeria ovina]